VKNEYAQEKQTRHQAPDGVFLLLRHVTDGFCVWQQKAI
jgi:hypothetical protein